MATASTLSLKNLLVASKAAEVEYPGMPGFKVSIAFLSRESLVTIRKKATKTVYKGRSLSEDFDEKLFLQLYTEAAIKGWTGLKLSYLEKLAPVDLSGQELDAELPFSTENALFLMQASSNFDSYISDNVADLGNFSSSNTKT